MPVPTRLPTLVPDAPTRVCRLQPGLVPVVQTAQRLEVVPRIIVRSAVHGTSHMIDLTRVMAARTLHAVITHHGPLALPPVEVQDLAAPTLPATVEPLTPSRTAPIIGHDDLQTKARADASARETVPADSAGRQKKESCVRMGAPVRAHDSGLGRPGCRRPRAPPCSISLAARAWWAIAIRGQRYLPIVSTGESNPRRETGVEPRHARNRSYAQ